MCILGLVYSERLIFTVGVIIFKLSVQTFKVGHLVPADFSKFAFQQIRIHKHTKSKVSRYGSGRLIPVPGVLQLWCNNSVITKRQLYLITGEQWRCPEWIQESSQEGNYGWCGSICGQMLKNGFLIWARPFIGFVTSLQHGSPPTRNSGDDVFYIMILVMFICINK